MTSTPTVGALSSRLSLSPSISCRHGDSDKTASIPALSLAQDVRFSSQRNAHEFESTSANRDPRVTSRARSVDSLAPRTEEAFVSSVKTCPESMLQKPLTDITYAPLIAGIGDGHATSRRPHIDITSSGKSAVHLVGSQEELKSKKNKMARGASQGSHHSEPFTTTSTYGFRDRKANQCKLIYDSKYHPMDDSVRPTQAAKRRLAHGEDISCSDDTNDEDQVTEYPEQDEDNESEIDTSSVRALQNKKRDCSLPACSDSIRRSSRKTKDPKVSYNMLVHPQDEELNRLNDDVYNTPIISRKKVKYDDELSISTRRRSNGRISSTGLKNYNISRLIDLAKTGRSNPCFEAVSSVSIGTNAHNESIAENVASASTMPPSSLLDVPPPYGIRKMEPMDIWNMGAGQRYFRHDFDSWPDSLGQPFMIHVDSIEDHLAEEALAASPLKFDHDDKENDHHNQDVEEQTNPTHSMSIMPVSTYRRTSDDERVDQHEAALNSVLLDDNIPGSRILDHNDHGVIEEHSGYVEESTRVDAMRILTSGESLQRDNSTEIHEQNEQVPLEASENVQEEEDVDITKFLDSLLEG